MIRIRYSMNEQGVRVSKGMLAGSKMVQVLDSPTSGVFQIVDLNTKDILFTNKVINPHSRMKEIKNVLVGMGVLFQQETRVRDVEQPVLETELDKTNVA